MDTGVKSYDWKTAGVYVFPLLSDIVTTPSIKGVSIAAVVHLIIARLGLECMIMNRSIAEVIVKIEGGHQ